MSDIVIPRGIITIGLDKNVGLDDFFVVEAFLVVLVLGLESTLIKLSSPHYDH